VLLLLANQLFLSWRCYGDALAWLIIRLDKRLAPNAYQKSVAASNI
jgi:hypothetical protein